VSIQAPNTFDLSADTALVDGLLSHTREIMGDIGSIPHHIIAFSGGVDSSLVAALVHHSQSSNNNEAVRAVLGISPAVPADQIDLARRVAAHIGISMSEIPTEEGSDETYIANNGQACLACKTHLYSTLQAVADHSLSNTKSTGIASSSHESLQQHQEQQHQQQLYNGTNADDVLDPTRLGLIAANNYRVQSPIRHISKADVRRAARHLGLPNWNYAASPCLRSRLALGVPAVQEHLQRIERAERFVRQQLSERSTTASMSMSASANTTTKPAATVLDETSNLRVRLLAGNRACIEVDPENLKAASQQLEQGSWQEHFCNDLGFTSVDIRSFKSGSVATTDNSIPASKETRASETTTSSTSDDDRAASFG
jgi:PP-loop superfamily ATP-utilizing enzyme